jgi:DmsE family decaheme c-type cytochrome
MKVQHRLTPIIPVAVTFAVLLAGAVLLTATPRNPGPQDAQYVGKDQCAACHEEVAKSFQGTVHAGSGFEMRSQHACETCHGAGKTHVDAGGGKGTMRNLKNLPSSESTAVCLTCHQGSGQKHWEGSTHANRDLACADCHNLHPKGEAPKALLAKPEQELCTGCHQQKKAAMMRSSHMPMREGKITCSSCHNPHGSSGPSMLLQSTVNQNCYTCHAEKRGPFLWEHAPVREDCMNCHDAHGTVNDSMLKVKQPVLCIQCHNGFAGGGMGNAHQARDRYTLNKSCVNCHAMIHGSTHPAGNVFFR